MMVVPQTPSPREKHKRKNRIMADQSKFVSLPGNPKGRRHQIDGLPLLTRKIIHAAPLRQSAETNPNEILHMDNTDYRPLTQENQGRAKKKRLLLLKSNGFTSLQQSSEYRMASPVHDFFESRQGSKKS
jgi:hypothetical protein